MQLDELARSAADALLDAVAEESAVRAPTRASRRARVIVFALVVALIAIGGLALLHRDTRNTTVTTGTNDVPRMIPTRIPAGLAATGAADLPLAVGRGADPTSEIAVFAVPGAETFAGPSLAVVVVRGFASPTSPGSGVEPVDIRGHQGWIEQRDDQTAVVWFESDHVEAQVIGRGIDKSALVAAAQSLDISDSNVLLPAPPNGLTLAAHVPSLSAQGGLSALTRTGASGHVVGYQSAGANSSLTVSTFQSDDDATAVLRFFLAADAPATQIRGHKGWIEDATNGNNAFIAIWEESPGIFVSVQGYALDRSAVLDAVDSLRPATDAEWNALRAMSPSQTETASSFSTVASSISTAPPSAPANALGSVTGAIGSTPYVVWLDPDHNLGLTFTPSQGSGGGTSGQDPQRGLDVPYARVQLFDGQFGLAYGRVPPAVARVRVVLANGNTSEGDTRLFAGQPFGLFALGFEMATPVDAHAGIDATLFFLDAGGHELNRMQVHTDPP